MRALSAIILATTILAPSAIAQEAVPPMVTQSVTQPVAQAPAPPKPMPADPAGNVRALKAGEEAAKKTLFATAPEGAAVESRYGSATLTLKDGTVRPANEAETVAILAYFNAKKAREEGEKQETMAILTAEERAELDAASTAVAMALPPRSRLYKTDAGWRVALNDGTVREPQGAEAEAMGRREAIVARLDARIDEVLAMRAAPLRVLADPSQKDRTGEHNDTGVLISQPLVFNRAAVLKGDLSARRDGFNTYTIPAGAKLFVVDGPDALQAYCLPSKSKAGLFKMLSDWIPCFLDKDGDGMLETQTNGGKPLGGVYMYASGFAPTGQVMQPAGFEDLPYLEGYQQRIGLAVTHGSFIKKTGTHKFVVHAWVGPDDKERQMVSGTLRALEAQEGVPTIIEMMGAKIEITATGKQRIAYRVVEPMPMQPYGLEMKTTYSTRRVYY
ncbi:MAG TPA: hypothetical protein VGO52_07015 [Hyphomonadaceae bacterium]|jgi:hypothetical protein|nr:hypothetical protein [Hyphomonadaceae bacterium]